MQPFPEALDPSFPIFLAGVTRTTGGLSTDLDAQDITAVAQIILVKLSIADTEQTWKLRPAQGGDASVSDGTTIVVPLTNPYGLRWIRIA